MKLIDADALIEHLNTTMYRDVIEEIKNFESVTPVIARQMNGSVLLIPTRKFEDIKNTVYSRPQGDNESFESNPQDEEWLDNFIKKYNESRDFQITDIRDREKLLDDLRPKGEWKVQRLQNGFDDVYCPFCNARPTRSEYGYYLKDKFCHECGADMRKGGDKE